MPLKKSVRSKTSAGAKKSSRAKRKSSTLGAGVIVMALVCVAAVALLMAAREASDAPEIATGAAETQIAADRTGAKKVAASRTSAAVPTATPTTGVVAADPDMESAPESPAKKATPVTIAGCLERGNGSFRLTDTAGSDAPKSRNWKSGFLKKGSASVELVESGNGLKLRDHVGTRVSVTGTLTDRQMRVQSVRRVAPSCS